MHKSMKILKQLCQVITTISRLDTRKKVYFAQHIQFKPYFKLTTHRFENIFNSDSVAHLLCKDGQIVVAFSWRPEVKCDSVSSSLLDDIATNVRTTFRR